MDSSMDEDSSEMKSLEGSGNKSSQDDDQALILRSYQIALVEKCRLTNSIIFLPTGSGKTCIAVYAMKSYGHTFEGKLEEGGKRCLFLAPTKALVYQQTQLLRQQTSFRVVGFTSENGVDYWPQSKWKMELDNNHVMVITPAIMQMILSHTDLRLDIFSIVIVDECHNGVGEQSFRGVMRELQNIAHEHRPRIIGLTATVLNRSIPLHQIQGELEALERTYHGKIATCDIFSEVIKYSANPKCSIVSYTSQEEFNILESIQAQCLKSAETCSIIFDEMERPKAPVGFKTFSDGSCKKTVGRCISDINVNLNEYGIYTASITILYYIIEFEQKRLLATVELLQYLYAEISSCLHQMRSVLLRMMGDNDTIESIHRFSSPKLLKLMEMLKTHGPDCRSIIFVERRTVAVTLSYILRKLSVEDPNFKMLKPSFLIGGRGNPLLLQRLNIIELRRMQTSLKNFNTGELNTMVATSVLEEGVDIPACSKVYHLSAEKIHYRTFIQCKGRARCKTGEFIMLVSEQETAKLRSKVKTCLEMEKALYKLLIGNYDIRADPTEESIHEDLYAELVEPYYVDGPESSHVNGVTAISCVLRYCSSLPQDKFSDLRPVLFSQRIEDKVRFAISLPINSPVHQLILGKPMSEGKVAKRSVFVEAVRTLHKAKELSDNLLPIKLAIDETNYDWIFPRYKKESVENRYLFPGSKKRRQMYDLKHPFALCKCLPQPGIPCYIHAFILQPTYEEPSENATRALYELFKNSATYAMLSTKPLPDICDFPLYISAGEIRCRIATNKNMVQVSENELNLIKRFHMTLFAKIECFSDFLILSQKNEENSFYVVPVHTSDNIDFKINWGVVNSVDDLIHPVSDDSFDDLNKTHYLKVISPDYRGKTDYYIVTNVLENCTPLSKFPDSETETFYSYFTNKYAAEITNTEQNLVEVKLLPVISSSFIKPRKIAAAGIRAKRKQLVGNDTFKEVLVPELCSRFNYPSVYWLKLMVLPTVLYRVNELLLVEELHQRICKEAGVGSAPATWAPLMPQLGEEKAQLEGSAGNPVYVAAAGVPSKNINEPMDLLSNMDKVADCDIKYFVDYIRTSKTPVIDVDTNDQMTIMKPPVTNGLKLNIFNSARSNGPELWELLAATTAKSVNDIVNLERMETLGDSFLKFAASWFLFLEFPKLNEGCITSLKGKLVSNRNLLYCGQAKDIPAVFQSQEFSPTGEWLPPLAEIPDAIREYLQLEKINPSVLYALYIPYEERLRGKVQRLTMERMLDTVSNTDTISDEQLMMRSMVQLKKKVHNDKGVADCVEALIGVYVLVYGLEGGLKLLRWLEILPSRGMYTTADNLLKIPAPTALNTSAPLHDVVFQLQQNQAKDLEAMLKYEFKDKSYLLQALTHATYSFHRATDCYQRLEFLGDAVLDFLITCYIYQEAPNLGPGDITALRSALVNNTTFACQVVKFGIHRYMLYFSKALADAIAAFASEQEKRGHTVDEAVVVLLEENDTALAESVDVPKALGDLMEALAGAVYLDSQSLEVVWTVFYPLFKSELDAFTKKIPRNSIQLLNELNVAQFRNITEVKPGIIRARVDLSLPSGNGATFYGFGNNSHNAKLSAAKLALRNYYILKDLPAKECDEP